MTGPIHPNRQLTSGVAAARDEVIAEATIEPPDGELQVRNFWYLVLRRRWMIGFCTVVVIAAAYAYVQRVIPVYAASASVIVDQQGRGMVLGNSPIFASNTQLGTEAEVLRSRSLAEDVADSLGLRFVVLEPVRVPRHLIFSSVNATQDAPPGEYVLRRLGPTAFNLQRVDVPQALGRTPISTPVALDQAGFTLAPSAREYELIRFQISSLRSTVQSVVSGVSVSQPRDANILAIRYTGTDPAVVQAVPNAIADLYIARRGKVEKTEASSTVSFLRAQVDTVSRQLKVSEDSLQAFQSQEQLVDVKAQSSSEVSRLVSLEVDRMSLTAERTALQALLRETTPGPGVQRRSGDLSLYRRVIASPVMTKSATASGIASSLQALEQQRAILLERRTERDPDVIALNTRIDDLEGQLGASIEAYVAGLTAQIDVQTAELARRSVQVQALPQRELNFARLERRQIFLNEIHTLLQTRLKEAEIAHAVEDPSVRVMDYAVLPLAPVSPQKTRTLLIAAALGLILGIVVATVREGLDRAVHSRDDIIRATGLPILGLIPVIRRVGRQRFALGRSKPARPALAARVPVAVAGSKVAVRESVATRKNGKKAQAGAPDRLIAGIDPRNPVSEAYRTLRTNITFAHLERPPRTVVFASPLPGDGKTTTAANLAITLAQQGSKVLLVDADMRRGVLNSVFRAPRAPGLSNVLVGAAKIDDVIATVDLDKGNVLKLLTTGTLPPNPAELLASQRMRDLIEELEQKFDTIIFDTPPLNIVTDAAVLGTITDGVLIVARSSVTTSDALSLAMQLLQNVRARVLGVVLNNVDMRRDGRYYFGGYGYYHNYYKYYAHDDKLA